MWVAGKGMRVSGVKDGAQGKKGGLGEVGMGCVLDRWGFKGGGCANRAAIRKERSEAIQISYG